MWVLSSMCSYVNRHLRACIRAPLLAATLTLLSACALSGGKSGADSSAAPSVAATPATHAAAGTPNSTSTVQAPVPAEAQQQFDKALAQLKAGQIAPATQQLQKLADTYPAFTGPLINLGLIELKANRYEPAAALFKRALERDPKSAAANNYLGVSYRYLGKFKEAESAYKLALTTDDTYAIAHLNLGVLYDLYLQKPELALPEYERYQALLPTPDAKVAGWIKEISSRLNAEKRTKAAATGASP